MLLYFMEDGIALSAPFLAYLSAEYLHRIFIREPMQMIVKIHTFMEFQQVPVAKPFRQHFQGHSPRAGSRL